MSLPYEAWGWDSDGDPVNTMDPRHARGKSGSHKAKRKASAGNAKQGEAASHGCELGLPETMLVNKQKLKVGGSTARLLLRQSCLDIQGKANSASNGTVVEARLIM